MAAGAVVDEHLVRVEAEDTPEEKIHLVMEATGVNEAKARQALERADRKVWVAIQDLCCDG